MSSSTRSGAFCAHFLERFLAAGGGSHLIGIQFQRRSADTAACWVRRPRPVCGQRSLGLALARSARRVEQQKKRKLAAVAGIALHPDLAAGRLYQPACNGQSEPVTLGTRVLVGQPEVLFEDLLLELGCDARAGVGYGDAAAVGNVGRAPGGGRPAACLLRLGAPRNTVRREARPCRNAACTSWRCPADWRRRAAL